MIRRVYAQGFKGLDFDQPLAPHTVIVGRVGSGKSSRALALTLAVTGSLPGMARNNDILSAIGDGNRLLVGIEFDNGSTFEREFRRKPKNGSVTSSCRVNDEPVAKNLFELELDRMGVCIADPAAFLALSDSKKIDELFRLFPPAGDVRGLNADIAKVKAAISEIEGDIRAKEQSCKSLTETLSQMQLPPATLPEIQAEIAKTEREYQEVRDEITRERARIELEAGEQAGHTAATPPEQLTLTGATPEVSSEAGEPQAPRPAGNEDGAAATERAVQALERVLSALERAGCEGCAAKMVLRRELRQLRNGA